jgi:folate-binding protein YgfZ
VTSPLLQRPGAVPADAPDEGVAGHYGDPYREQRELAAGRGAVDLSHRPVVRVTGPDRLSWLHSLLSQHVAGLQPGQSTEALVLSPNGHVEHHLQLVETGEEVLAHVEPGTAQALVDFLDRMRFMLRVEVALAEDLAVVWEQAGSPPEQWPCTDTGFGRHLLVPRAQLAAWEVTAGVQAYEALRVAARRPRLGRDTDHRTLPHEAGWLTAAVHLDKGCYRGQETVARVHNLGRPPRRLALLHLDDADLPAAGSPVVLGEREVGRVGSAVRHHELGPIGLALLKRNVADSAELLAGGVAARIDPSPVEDVPESPARAAAAARAGLLRF